MSVKRDIWSGIAFLLSLKRLKVLAKMWQPGSISGFIFAVLPKLLIIQTEMNTLHADFASLRECGFLDGIPVERIAWMKTKNSIIEHLLTL